MHHFRAKEAVSYFASRAHTRALGELRGLAAVEIEETHHKLAAVVGNRDHKLPARPELHFACRYHAFHLGWIAGHETGFANRHYLCFVFIAQWQMQHQIHIRTQSKARELVLDLVGASGFGRLLLGCWHRQLGGRA